MVNNRGLVVNDGKVFGWNAWNDVEVFIRLLVPVSLLSSLSLQSVTY